MTAASYQKSNALDLTRFPFEQLVGLDLPSLSGKKLARLERPSIRRTLMKTPLGASLRENRGRSGEKFTKSVPVTSFGGMNTRDPNRGPICPDQNLGRQAPQNLCVVGD